MPRKIAPSQFSYADALRLKNEAREQQRARVQAGRISPRVAQERASLFHGVQSRVVRHGQGAAI
ncbi:MAG: hypothetical protein LV481_15015 [Methylacidiphilales bacterium]|nr:hypothetical protein [Candidatus Methylacidiphilales bacterium]